MKTIIFDKTAAYWTPIRECNLQFLKAQGDYIKNQFMHKGYIYLNQIYESFGVAWNPGLVNSLYLIGSGPITFEFEPVNEDDILIHIKQ